MANTRDDEEDMTSDSTCSSNRMPKARFTQVGAGSSSIHEAIATLKVALQGDRYGMSKAGSTKRLNYCAGNTFSDDSRL